MSDFRSVYWSPSLERFDVVVGPQSKDSLRILSEATKISLEWARKYLVGGGAVFEDVTRGQAEDWAAAMRFAGVQCVVESRSMRRHRLLAEALQLDGLAVGCEMAALVGDADLTRHRVVGLWCASIEPSFHSSALIGAALGVPSDRNDHRTNPRLVAAMVTDSGTASVELDDDPVYESLRSVSLCSVKESETLTLDGIGYSLSLETQEVSAAVRFANPWTKTWKGAELAMLQVGERIAAGREGTRVRKYVDIWKKYVCESSE